MKKGLTITATILFLCALAPHAVPVEMSDKVIAIVNDDVITMSDLIKEGGEDVTGDPDRVLPNGKTVAEARDMALEQIIMRKILDQTVEEYGIDITDKDVEKAIEDQMKINGLTKKDLIEILAKEGMTYDEYKEEIEYRIKKERLVSRKVGSHIIITDEDIQKYFNEHKSDYKNMNEYRVSEIIIPFPMNATEGDIILIRERAEDVRKKLIAGADFAKMAKEYSAAADAESGGDMGYLNPKDIDPNFLLVLRSMKIGQISELIPTGVGFIIFKITDIRPMPGEVTVDDVRNEILSILRTEKTLIFFDKWMNELREEAFVNKML
jgi:peptidyl-prolyl cis-trans isomerase SurA